MQRSLIGRLEALEQVAGSSRGFQTILVSFVAPSDHGPVDVEPIAIKSSGTAWSLDREPGEAVEAFRLRAFQSCPRPESGLVTLMDVIE